MSNKINLANERRARLAAERILQIKQAELYSVNCNLSQRTKDLNQEIDQTRAKINNVLDENLRVKTDLSAANQRIRIAERRLHHSLNTIRDGFAVFDRDSKLVFANDKGCFAGTVWGEYSQRCPKFNTEGHTIQYDLALRSRPKRLTDVVKL